MNHVQFGMWSFNVKLFMSFSLHKCWGATEQRAGARLCLWSISGSSLRGGSGETSVETSVRLDRSDVQGRQFRPTKQGQRKAASAFLETYSFTTHNNNGLLARHDAFSMYCVQRPVYCVCVRRRQPVLLFTLSPTYAELLLTSTPLAHLFWTPSSDGLHPTSNGLHPSIVLRKFKHPLGVMKMIH